MIRKLLIALAASLLCFSPAASQVSSAGGSSGGGDLTSGPIRSSAGASTINAQTGTGSTIVVDTSPTLVTPNIGAATGTSVNVTGNITAGGNLTASNGSVQAAGTAQILWSGRGTMSSPIAGTIQLGAPDTAAPVAQFLQAQSVITGTSNTGGALFTFRDSNGTGTGGSGGYSWLTAGPAGSGSTPLTQTSKMTLSNTGSLAIAQGLTSGSGNSTFNGNITTSGNYTAGGTATIGWTGRGVLTSPGAAIVQFGSADTAAPVAQVTQPQSVVAGTADTTGATWIFRDSMGTGTGNSGGFAWQTAPGGSSGSAQNTYATRMTLSTSGGLAASGNISSSSGSITAAGGVTAGASSLLSFNGRGGWTSPVAATIQQGNVDNVSPSAQTTQVQSVATGNTDTAGALWTFKDSNGTGTGGSGGYAWFTAAPGSSGSTPLTQTSKMTLSNAGVLSFGGTTLISSAGITAGSLTSTGNITSGGNVTALATGLINFASARGILSSPAAGTIQLGNADAAAPVAQTFQSQSVVAGTTNTVGALTKFIDSGGTGTGASGGFEWDTHPAGSTGSAQNAAVSKMTLSSAGVLGVTGNVSIGGTFTTGGGGTITSGGNITAASASAINWTSRGILSSPGTGSIQLGTIDNATPVAQTLRAQSVSAGTADTAGQNLTIAGSRGTGTGAGGDILLKVAPAGSTGSTVNAEVTAFTIHKTGVPVRPVFAVASLPVAPPSGAMAAVNDNNSACTFGGTPTGGGSTYCPVGYTGSAWAIGY